MIGRSQVAELVIRDLIDDSPDQPLIGEYFRGFGGIRGIRVETHAHATRGAADPTSALIGMGWYVKLIPTHEGVRVTAEAGHPVDNLLNDGETVIYGGQPFAGVNANAILSPEFRRRLEAAVARQSEMVTQVYRAGVGGAA